MQVLFFLAEKMGESFLVLRKYYHICFVAYKTVLSLSRSDNDGKAYLNGFLYEKSLCSLLFVLNLSG